MRMTSRAGVFHDWDVNILSFLSSLCSFGISCLMRMNSVVASADKAAGREVVVPLLQCAHLQEDSQVSTGDLGLV